MAQLQMQPFSRLRLKIPYDSMPQLPTRNYMRLYQSILYKSTKSVELLFRHLDCILASGVVYVGPADRTDRICLVPITHARTVEYVPAAQLQHLLLVQRHDTDRTVVTAVLRYEGTSNFRIGVPQRLAFGFSYKLEYLLQLIKIQQVVASIIRFGFLPKKMALEFCQRPLLLFHAAMFYVAIDEGQKYEQEKGRKTNNKQDVHLVFRRLNRGVVVVDVAIVTFGFLLAGSRRVIATLPHLLVWL